MKKMSALIFSALSLSGLLGVGVKRNASPDPGFLIVTQQDDSQYYYKSLIVTQQENSPAQQGDSRYYYNSLFVTQQENSPTQQGGSPYYYNSLIRFHRTCIFTMLRSLNKHVLSLLKTIRLLSQRAKAPLENSLVVFCFFSDVYFPM
jgi:hypothetical protein